MHTSQSAMKKTYNVLRSNTNIDTHNTQLLAGQVVGSESDIFVTNMWFLFFFQRTNELVWSVSVYTIHSIRWNVLIIIFARHRHTNTNNTSTTIPFARQHIRNITTATLLHTIVPHISCTHHTLSLSITAINHISSKTITSPTPPSHRTSISPAKHRSIHSSTTV